MPESPSSSFIPKRGVGKKPTVARKSNFVVLSIVSYALFVSAPLASAAVFIYERHSQNQFNKAVVALDQAIENFKVEDLKRVTDFSERLSLTKKLLESHVSMVKLLNAIEVSTAQTVKFKSMDIARTDASSVAVTGLLSTSKFDGALFQRSAYDAAEIINNPLFSDVSLLRSVAKDATGATSEGGERSVEFKVAFSISAADVQYKSVTEDTTSLPVVAESVPAATATTTDEDTIEESVSSDDDGDGGSDTDI